MHYKIASIIALLGWWNNR